jgi:4-hydroxybenzoate polyprenyltransferase
MVDQTDDARLGVHSTAILFGSYAQLITGFLQLSVLLLLGLVGHLFGLGDFFYLSILAAAVLFIRQQFLIRNKEPEACLKAFLENNYIGGIIFLGIVLNVL